MSSTKWLTGQTDCDDDVNIDTMAAASTTPTLASTTPTQAVGTADDSAKGDEMGLFNAETEDTHLVTEDGRGSDRHYPCHGAGLARQTLPRPCQSLDLCRICGALGRLSVPMMRASVLQPARRCRTVMVGMPRGGFTSVGANFLLRDHDLPLSC